MDMKYGVLQVSGIRSRQLKASNNKVHSDIQDKLEWAFEEGYRLGRDDAKEGIFIDMDTVVDQFRFTMSAANDSR
jgi:hypothetical protein